MSKRVAGIGKPSTRPATRRVTGTRYPTTMENGVGLGSLFSNFAGMGIPATRAGIPVKPDNTRYF